MNRSLACAATAVTILCLLEPSGGAQTPVKTAAGAPPPAAAAATGRFSALFGVHRFDQAAISPDGRSLAWVELLMGMDGAANGKNVIQVSAARAGATPRRITAGPAAATYDEGHVSWSPDSKRIAFLSDAAKSGQLQLYVVDAAGGAARKLTSVKGFLNGPSWSPDGKTLAVLFTENATRAAGPLVAGTPETGEIKDAFFEQRLALVDVATGQRRQISPADTYVYEYDWAPDSKGFFLTAAKGNGDNNWWVAELYRLDVAGGPMKAIYKPTLQIARPSVSPDGRHVAFVEGIMSDEDSVGGDVFLVPTEGGAPRNLTPGRKASAAALSWSADGRLIVSEDMEGESAVARLDPGSAHAESLYRAPEMLSAGAWATNISLSSDGSVAAFIRSSYASPPEIWAGSMGTWAQITRRNAGVKPAWGEAKSIRWKSDGLDVQGWLIYPRDFDASKRYPMVVSVHGGPGGAVQPEWPSVLDYQMALPAAGYFLFRPNPRGSFGQGEAFTLANVKDFGYGDWRDVLAGVDEVLRVAPVDAHRLGLTGWSYGGYMTMWGVTQTDRFRAAVAGAGIANWSSYYGENKIDQWMIPFFGKSVYDDPDVYARSGPLTYIKNVKTPTLVLVGDSDAECPTPQSYEFWHALKTLGVETKLVVYEREGHMFVKPDHQRDVIDRSVAWFDAHLK